MSTNASSGQESGGRTDPQPAHRNELAAAADEKTLKRARWEHLRLTACAGTGRVNVCNVSYGVQAKSDHTYTVTVERGEPTDCTCSAATYQSGPCKHAVAVAGDREVLDEAMGVATDGGQPAATDGGDPVNDLSTETLDDAAAMGSNVRRDEDDPDVRPSACDCRVCCLTGDPCSACREAGFETINEYDVSVADGGKRKLEADR